MSVTAVPLQPIKKGSVLRYWIGIALVLAAAAALAWWGTAGFRPVTTESGLRFQEVKAGSGPHPTDADIALVGYKGTLKDGTVFDQNPQAPMEVARMIPGLTEALKMMQKGGEYKIVIPPKIGYGKEDIKDPQTGKVVIPGNSELTFEVTMHDFRSVAEVQAQMQQQMMQQLQQGGGAAQGGAPQGGPQGAPPQGGAPGQPAPR